MDLPTSLGYPLIAVGDLHGQREELLSLLAMKILDRLSLSLEHSVLNVRGERLGIKPYQIIQGVLLVLRRRPSGASGTQLRLVCLGPGFWRLKGCTKSQFGPIIPHGSQTIRGNAQTLSPRSDPHPVEAAPAPAAAGQARWAAARREVDLREVLNGICQLTRGGCSWRMMPKDLPPWSTCYDSFRKWRNDGTWAKVNDALRTQVRHRAQRKKSPRMTIIDTQSVKTTAVPCSRAPHRSAMPWAGRTSTEPAS